PEACKPKMPKASSHPAYSAMIRRAVSELEEMSGSLKAAILKFMLSRFKFGANITRVIFPPIFYLRINFHLRGALNKAVVKGELKQVKEIGASGRFKLGKKKSISAAEKLSGERRAHFVPHFSDATSKKTKSEKKAKSTKTVKALKAKTGKKPISEAVMPKASKSKV
ncbi:hypothetical protein Angca_007150, partial [Angiostrongylus cantonensis]